MKPALKLAAILVLLLSASGARAWDSVGHRVTALIAREFISDNTTSSLMALLEQHPRFEADFLSAMPDSIRRASAEQRNDWLLGQAAYWPDLARSLPPAVRERFNRPNWHYTDGAWVRGAAPFQGNTYVGVARFVDIQGEAADSIRSESTVNNLVSALDYNAGVLKDETQSAADRAVALCWFLHLAGDIHQPLHTGSLFSRYIFDDGDAGGNGVPTTGGNLHARWDGALRDDGIATAASSILEQLTRFNNPLLEGVESDWTVWLNESRQLLQSVVYTDQMKTAIAEADSTRSALPVLNLSDTYIAQMQRISLERLGLAGLRMAIWFENEFR